MPVSAPGPETRVYEPAELNREVRAHLEAGFPRLWLSGEISNLARPGSGHLYFSLKDARAQLRCAMFRGRHGNLQTQPENGDRVLVRGRLSLYEPRGDYQLIADALLPAGSGALQQAFEALKRKLEAEGLFDPQTRRALPRYPGVIAVVTSATGAAVRDILTTLRRRWPAARVRLHATPVQGDAAVPGLLAALGRIERERIADVVLVARGGGSIEDLWAFNDERVARRIAAMTAPVVTGIGHETDITIADFVADLRAATPTAAAEAATPDGPALRRQVEALTGRLERISMRRLQDAWQRLDLLHRRLENQHPRRGLDTAEKRIQSLERRFSNARRRILEQACNRHAALAARLRAASPARRLQAFAERLARLARRLPAAVAHRIERAEARLAGAARALDAVSPLAVLGRGYAIIEDESGRLLSRPDEFSPGQTVHTRLRDVRVTSVVRDIEPAELPEAMPRPEPD